MRSRIELHMDELIRLYVDEREPLPAIAQRFGVTSQTIGNRLRDGGVQLRTRGSRRGPPIDAEEVERLYRGGVPVIAIAKRFGSSQARISATLKSRGFSDLQAKPHGRKNPELWDLAVGEHLDVASPSRRHKYTAYYERAKRIGIRISIRSLDERTVRVTCVGSAPKDQKRGPRITVAEMVRLRKRGKMLHEIAERAGLTISGVVRYHLRRMRDSIT